MSADKDIFDKERLTPGLDSFLRDVNPWWEQKPGPALPAYKRWAFNIILSKFQKGLAPVVVIRGPRQVGKTTLQLQIIEDLIENKGVPRNHILRVQFDEIPSLRSLQEPILSISRWFENRILGCTFNETARAGRPACLFFDEIQNLKDWAPQLKALVDHHTVKVLLTGSSALRIEAGRDSLAGRITPVELGTLLLREVAGLRFSEDIKPHLPDNGLEPLLQKNFWKYLEQYGESNQELRDKAFAAFSERGGYPMAQAHPEVAWPEIADQLNETVIQRAIQNDLRVGTRGLKRDPQLLEEVFRMSCRYAGQSPGQAIFVNEIKRPSDANIGWNRILTYLRFLDSSMLIKLISPLELRLKKKRGASKLCLCDHGLRASWLQEIVPLDRKTLINNPHLQDLAEHIAESTVGYFLGSLPYLDVAHFPERGSEPEVDFILTIGEKRIPLEVKYRNRIDMHRDTVGIRAFLEKTVYNAPFGILVTMHDGVTSDDPRIVPILLPSFLLLR